RPWLVPAAVGVLALAVGTSTLGMSDITRARLKRVLNVVEFLVVVDLLVLLAGALGVYGLLGGLL
ncbi:hypothetical protein, partial [Solicola sp. PLA-1-18]|uniref:hypothetical protein n=1 Tax=Solicola sp. PLA-1-18 TaxID=3380532 RepID=UPI003B766798